MRSYNKYRNRVQGMEDVAVTVKTVEKIAASSVHLLKRRVTHLNDYITEVKSTLNRLAMFYQGKSHPLLQPQTEGKKALVVLAGNKGLVGGLWHDIVNVFLESAEDYPVVIAVGKKGADYIKEEGRAATKVFDNLVDIPQAEEIAEITDFVFDGYRKQIFSQVDVLYPKFTALAEQTPDLVSYLPFRFESMKDDALKEGWPIFEPSSRVVFDALVQKYIGIYFYKIVMETKLSELAARTVTMEHAAAKTKELIYRTRLDYAKERRRMVTQENLESFTAHKVTIV